MPISDIVTINITKQTTGIDRVGFGTPIIFSTEAAVDSKFADTAKLYSALDELGSTGDDFDTDGVTYKKALALLSQNPKVGQFVIGKRSNSPLMTLETIPEVFANTLYRISISGAHTATSETGVTNFDYTSDASPGLSEIITGLFDTLAQAAWAPSTAYLVGDYVSNNDRVYICTTAGLSDGSGGPTGTGSGIVDNLAVWAFKGPTQNVSGVDNTTSLTIQKAVTPGGVGTAGIPFYIEINDRSLLPLQNNTADPGLAADLTAVRTNVDGNDNWYLALLDSYGQAEIEAFAALIEATGTPAKAYFFATSDEDCLTTAVDDVFSNLQSSAYVRTMGIWHETPGDAIEAGWAGVGLPKDPGSITWNLKTIAGAAVSTLTTSEKSNVQGKDGNYYIRIAGVNLTQTGITPGNDFFDVTRGIDFIAARLGENIFFRLQALDKVPFTDAGIAIVENEVRGVLLLGVSQSIFTADPEPTVTVPRANDVDTVDRANRLLPDVNFTAQLAGAIHEVIVNGTVTV